MENEPIIAFAFAVDDDVGRPMNAQWMNAQWMDARMRERMDERMRERMDGWFVPRHMNSPQHQSWASERSSWRVQEFHTQPQLQKTGHPKKSQMDLRHQTQDGMEGKKGQSEVSRKKNPWVEGCMKKKKKKRIDGSIRRWMEMDCSDRWQRFVDHS